MIELDRKPTVILRTLGITSTSDEHPVARTASIRRLFSGTFTIDRNYAEYLAGADTSLDNQNSANEKVAGRRKGLWKTKMDPELERLIREAEEQSEEEEPTESEPIDLARPTVEPSPEKVDVTIDEDDEQDVRPWKDESEMDAQSDTTRCTSCQSWFSKG